MYKNNARILLIIHKSAFNLIGAILPSEIKVRVRRSERELGGAPRRTADNVKVCFISYCANLNVEYFNRC